MKIALNAGHGLYTAGKRCLKELDVNETREWFLNKRICENITQILSGYGNIEVLRLDDVSGEKDIPLKVRTNTANNWGADFYLSIHHNAGINGGVGGGIETYIYTKASEQSKVWQEKLYNSLIEYTSLKGNRSNGLRRKNLHELRESKMPAVLIECGFMDSVTDVPIILSDVFAENVAKACVEVIVSKGNSVLKESVKSNAVLEWQNAAIADGFKFPKYGADGRWGNECEEVAKKAVCKRRNVYVYPALTKIVQAKVGVSVDGKFGNDTKNAVINFQRNNNLSIDGCVGINTWKAILGVK